MSGFGDDSPWIQKVRGERFGQTMEGGILYRPYITDQLVGRVEAALGKVLPNGIMVKGPQGIGKSHSLVNLVRKLEQESDGKYLVTFVPDCEKWDTLHDLYASICSSFGATTADLSLRRGSYEDEN
eukprot:scaffold209758_cov40-Attheya_sp.AAC.1